MKRFVLLAGIGFGTCLFVRAQTPDTTLPQSAQRKASPTRQAARQLKTLEQQLHLTQDQVLQLQVILINRDIAMDSLRNNPSVDHRGESHTRRGIIQTADQQINSLLTADQKPLYQQWKQAQRDKAMQRRLDSTSQPQ